MTHKITKDDVEQSIGTAEIHVASSSGIEESKLLTYHPASRVYTVTIDNKEVLSTLFVDKAVLAYNKELEFIETKAWHVMRDSEVTGGSGLCGYVEGTWHFADLIEKFGKPTYINSGDKTQAEWVIQFNDEDNTIARVYDYKEYGVALDAITEWHIGGESQKAVELVNGILNDK